MNTTRATLLVRVRDHADHDAWNEFHRLYAPLLLRYARSRGLGTADAEEVRDQCLEVVARKIRTFEYDRDRGFKNWLFRIAHGKVVDTMRRQNVRRAHADGIQRLADVEAPDADWEREWRQEHLRFCLEDVRYTVPERSYRAFHMLLFDDASTDAVCTSLGMNANMVYKAKSRVLALIRERMERLGVE